MYTLLVSASVVINQSGAVKWFYLEYCYCQTSYLQPDPWLPSQQGHQFMLILCNICRWYIIYYAKYYGIVGWVWPVGEKLQIN